MGTSGTLSPSHDVVIVGGGAGLRGDRRDRGRSRAERGDRVEGLPDAQPHGAAAVIGPSTLRMRLLPARAWRRRCAMRSGGWSARGLLTAMVGSASQIRESRCRTLLFGIIFPLGLMVPPGCKHLLVVLDYPLIRVVFLALLHS
jgi:hypothetical protein